jgi:hypothetical protein
MEMLNGLEGGDRHLKLSKNERAVVIETLSGYLHDKSSKVRMFSMQALANLAMEEAILRPQVIALLEESLRTGNATTKNRGRKLLESLKRIL